MSVTAFLSRIIIVTAVINAAVFLPSLGGFKLNFFASLSKLFVHLSSNVFFLIEKVTLMIATYCSEDLGRDLKKFVHHLVQLGKRAAEFLSPGNMLGEVGDALVAVHKNGKAYTEDILIQLLGAQGIKMPEQNNHYTLFFYKNKLYKNTQAEISPKIKS